MIIQKRIIVVVLCFLLLFSGFSCDGYLSFLANAETSSGKIGYDINWIFDKSNGGLTISGSGELDIGARSPWEDFCDSIIEVIIGDGITGVGEEAFKNCANLARVSLPDSIQYLDYCSFSYCDSLKSITLPQGLKHIGADAFYMSGLESIEIPGSVDEIASGAFCQCYNLKTLVMNEGLTKIGSWAFSDCRSLLDITIPETVCFIDRNAFAGTGYINTESNWDHGCLYIGSNLIHVSIDLTGACSVKAGTKVIAAYAFESCRKLTSVTIPDGVKRIELYTFENCEKVKEVHFPSSIEYIGAKVFDGCSSLTQITLPDNIMEISCTVFDGSALYENARNWKDGILYVGNYLIYAGEDCSGECIIHQGTKCIAVYAFHNSKITRIVIPDSVVSIGAGCFKGCEELTDVVLSNNIIKIGEDAFSFCGITQIKIPGSLRIIEKNTFVASKLVKVEIEDGVESIEECAFYNCPIRHIHIPKSVTSIGDDVFVTEAMARNEWELKWICSDTDDCYAKEYAENIGTKFRQCLGHHKSDLPIKLSFDRSDVVLRYGESLTLVPIIENQDLDEIEWSTTNQRKVEVKDGDICGVGRGKAIITCKVTGEDGSTDKAECVVKVKYTWWQWYVMIFLFGWIWYK